MKLSQRLQQMTNQANSDHFDAWDGASPARPPQNGRGGYAPSPGLGGGLWQGLLGRSLEMAEVQEEVAAEQQGQVAIIGPDPTLNRLLLARLRQQPPVPGGEAICREGFFTLVQRPDELASTPTDADETETSENWSPRWDAVGFDHSPQHMIESVADHDILIYLFPAHPGWQAQDAHWYARLRAAHVPLLPVAVLPAEKAEDWGEEAFCKAMRDRLGVRPALMDLHDAAQWDGHERDDHVLALVQRILSLRPRLAVALAQEIPACRTLIAHRVIRTGTMMTLLLGAEPIPLLDLPLHVATQWKVALQLAAIYGRPGLDYRSREMAGTVAVNLVVRHLAQQLLKLVPLVGWLLSGLLSGLSTWLMGQALIRHYQELQVIPLPDWQPQQWAEQVRQGVKDRLPEKPDVRLFDKVERFRPRRKARPTAAAPSIQEIPIEIVDPLASVAHRNGGAP